MSYALDDYEQARDIVLFWTRGMASNFETKFIELYLAADNTLRERLYEKFPAFARAIEDYRHGSIPGPVEYPDI